MIHAYDDVLYNNIFYFMLVNSYILCVLTVNK